MKDEELTPLEQRQPGPKVHLQTVGSTIEDLLAIAPKRRILAQKEAIEIWAPYYDRLVALFLETTVNSWPCQHYPQSWPERAQSLLCEYRQLRRTHKLCAKPERGGHFTQLRDFLARCASRPQSLSGREVSRIRLILNEYVAKRGTPGSSTCVEARRRQSAYVSGPTFHEIAQAVIPRLRKHRANEGLDDVTALQQPLSKEEAAAFDLPEGTPIPQPIQRKLERCLNATLEVLIERKVIKSGGSIALVMPQITSGIRVDLPSSGALLAQTLKDITGLTLRSFPHEVLPNTLLQELRALAELAELDIPLVEEIKPRIFMQEFTGKYYEPTKRAARLLSGTLYETYYDIDYDQVRKTPPVEETPVRRWLWSISDGKTDPFFQFCSSRAGVSIGTVGYETNETIGRIREQQQILTTQNLAALFLGLNLVETLRDDLGNMAQRCFKRVFAHGENSGSAWRQMVFYLSLTSKREVEEFITWAELELQEQAVKVRNRLRPELERLKLVSQGLT